MTIKELYEWAIEHKAENLDLHILYRDGGGYYSGYDDMIEPGIFFDETGRDIVEI